LPEEISAIWSLVLAPVLVPWAFLFLGWATWKVLGSWEQAGSGELRALAFSVLITGVIVWVIDFSVRERISDNLKRITSYYRAHETASKAPQPMALLLRSFGQVHGYLDAHSGFSVFWFLDRALVRSGLRPVMLGAPTSLPPDYSMLFLSSTDENWQGIFERYAAAAALILIIPETTRSLNTELTVLRQRGWLAKTVIVMTPASIPRKAVGGDMDWYLGGDDATRKSRWTEAASQFHGIGISLPNYDPAGALIELNAEGTLAQITPLGIDRASMEKGEGQRGFFAPDRDPNDADRYSLFSDAWTSLTNRRRFRGPALSEVFENAYDDLPCYGWPHVLRPPGDDGTLWINLRSMLILGWAIPIFGYSMKIISS
jgi:hypothetical protein